MATTKTVTGKVTGFDGTNKGAAAVVITPSQACYIAGTQEVVPSRVMPTVAADGSWSAQLYANNDLTPNGTYYTVQMASLDGGYQILTIQVPQTAGPFEVANLVTSTPTASPTPNHVSTLTVDGAATFTAGPISAPAGSIPLSAVSGSIGGQFGKGQPWFDVGSYGAKGDGVTDDTAAIQAAINAAQAVHGVVFLPTGTYKLTTALSVTNHVTIQGAGIAPIWGSQSVGALNVPITSPYLIGSVLLQTAPATDALTITAVGTSVSLLNFGVRFADAIKYSNTGHGINVNPPAYQTYQDNGIFFGEWRNLWVYGHDGNHYAYRRVNCIHLNFYNLAWVGGGGVEDYTNSSAYNYGNSTYKEVAGSTCAGGTAHCFYFHANGTTNIISLDHIGAWTGSIAGVTPAPTNAQALLQAGAGTLTSFVLIAPDFESTVSSGWTPPSQCQIVGMGYGANPQFNPALANGSVYTNNSGTAQLIRASVTCNPTAGAAATCTILIANNSGMTGAVEMAKINIPATGLAGTVIPVTVPLLSSWTIQANYTNCTVSDTGGYPVAGSYL